MKLLNWMALLWLAAAAGVAGAEPLAAPPPITAQLERLITERLEQTLTRDTDPGPGSREEVRDDEPAIPEHVAAHRQTDGDAS